MKRVWENLKEIVPKISMPKGFKNIFNRKESSQEKNIPNFRNPPVSRSTTKIKNNAGLSSPNAIDLGNAIADSTGVETENPEETILKLKAHSPPKDILDEFYDKNKNSLGTPEEQKELIGDFLKKNSISKNENLNIKTEEANTESRANTSSFQPKKPKPLPKIPTSIKINKVDTFESDKKPLTEPDDMASLNPTLPPKPPKPPTSLKPSKPKPINNTKASIDFESELEELNALLDEVLKTTNLEDPSKQSKEVEAKEFTNSLKGIDQGLAALQNEENNLDYPPKLPEEKIEDLKSADEDKNKDEALKEYFNERKDYESENVALGNLEKSLKEPDDIVNNKDIEIKESENSETPKLDNDLTKSIEENFKGSMPPLPPKPEGSMFGNNNSVPPVPDRGSKQIYVSENQNSLSSAVSNNLSSEKINDKKLKEPLQTINKLEKFLSQNEKLLSKKKYDELEKRKDKLISLSKKLEPLSNKDQIRLVYKLDKANSRLSKIESKINKDNVDNSQSKQKESTKALEKENNKAMKLDKDEYLKGENIIQENVGSPRKAKYSNDKNEENSSLIKKINENLEFYKKNPSAFDKKQIEKLERKINTAVSKIYDLIEKSDDRELIKRNFLDFHKLQNILKQATSGQNSLSFNFNKDVKEKMQELNDAKKPILIDILKENYEEKDKIYIEKSNEFQKKEITYQSYEKAYQEFVDAGKRLYFDRIPTDFEKQNSFLEEKSNFESNKEYYEQEKNLYRDTLNSKIDTASVTASQPINEIDLVRKHFSHPPTHSFDLNKFNELNEKYAEAKKNYGTAKSIFENDLDFEKVLKDTDSSNPLEESSMSSGLKKSYEKYTEAKKNYDHASKNLLEEIKDNPKEKNKILQEKNIVEKEAENYEKQIPKNDNKSDLSLT